MDPDTFHLIDTDATTHRFVKGGPAGEGWHSAPGVSLSLVEHAQPTGEQVFEAIRPDGLSYRFRPQEERYLLSKISDRAGNALEFSYAGGLLQEIRDPNGRSLSFSWSGSHLSLVRFQAQGETLEVSYALDSATKRLSSVTEAPGTPSERTTRYSYTEGFGLSSVTDGRGSTTTFQGSAGVVKAIFDRAGKPWRLSYGGACVSSSSATCLSDPEGALWAWVISPDNNVIEEIDAGDRDENGAPRANRRLFSWEQNRLEKEVDEAGNVTEYDWSPLGQVAELRFSGAGEETVTTRFSYQAASEAVADLIETRVGAGSPE
ncbi:MAG: hypothetical protein ACREKA_13520, partial [Candidatus Methylomirabilales bacterium]